jgi:spore cortex biosynthesis protein YabQ
MNVHIRFEAWLLILSFLSGCWLMAVYDVLRLLRLAFPTGAEDLLYWLYASLLTFSLLYTQNSGLVRAYVIAGVFAGMVLYNNFISRILFKLLKKLIKYFKMKRKP